MFIVKRFLFILRGTFVFNPNFCAIPSPTTLISSFSSIYAVTSKFPNPFERVLFPDPVVPIKSIPNSSSLFNTS
jgi:hypothetical protein